MGKQTVSIPRNTVRRKKEILIHAITWMNPENMKHTKEARHILWFLLYEVPGLTKAIQNRM